MKSKLFAPVDMTVGEPVIQIIKFTIPMLLGNVAQQLYNTVDSIIVGRFVGDNALATVIAQFVSAFLSLRRLTRTPELPQGNCAMMYVSMLISWSLGAVITLVVYRMGKWKAKANLVTGNS